MSCLYARVILPLSVSESYTYKVPLKFMEKISVGQRVVVQFGSKKLYSAVVIFLSEKVPEGLKTKEIIQILDNEPVLLPRNFELWHWIADYYCCNLGDIYRAAVPPGLKLESKSKVFITPNEEQYILSESEQIIMDNLENDNNSLERIQQTLGKNFSFRAFKMLIDKNLIQVEEKLSQDYKPKTSTYISLDPGILTEKELNIKTDSLQRAKKQQALLIHFCERVKAFGNYEVKSIGRKELLDNSNFSNSLLNELIRKKILISFQKKISRINIHSAVNNKINVLNEYQRKALFEIKSGFDEKRVVLIHGLPASGKTEIYIHLIDEAVKSGKQVLYLVPEIALTTQIIERLGSVFGRKVGVYHSRLNSSERIEIWNRVLQFQNGSDNDHQVILGARSAVFLPFSALGLVIVDEEHENSFKQFDPAPRYNARDMAVILGIKNSCPVLLGSATPSYESYYNAITGKYKLVNLDKRYLNTDLPEVIIADIIRSRKRKKMHSFLTPELFSLIKASLEKEQQVILFQNRRGYSPYIQCFNCGWIPKCKNCDVSLTYHKYKKQLNCHYCGYSEQVPDECNKCGSDELKTHGYGTEQVEDELRSLFPKSRIDRMDLDTTHTKNAFRRIINKLENRETDILIGTQMVTKGLDLKYVSVVGILDADNLINFPDFRAHERAFQLISQVSGRAGRWHVGGKVVVQTSQPGHPLIKFISQHDYLSAFHMQINERRLFKYPPYFRLIKLVVKHRKFETVNRAAYCLAEKLRKQPLVIVLGPEYPLISRIQLFYQKEIWLKVSRKISPDRLKKSINNIVGEIKKRKDCSNCKIIIDVDPA